MATYKLVLTKTGLYWRSDTRSLYWEQFDAVRNSRPINIRNVVPMEREHWSRLFEVREYRDECNSVCRDIKEIYDF